MKHVLYSIFTGLMLSANAQPTLRPEALPANGTHTEVVFSIVPSDPGASGANVTWDFSKLPYQDQPVAVAIVDPATTTHFAKYRTANFCVRTSFGTENMYSYYRLDAKGLYTLADGISDEGVDLDFSSDSKLWIPFPLRYKGTAADTYKGAKASGKETITYDGYGTLITPKGTYQNVVRFKELNEDSEGTYTTYTWYSTDPIFQIFEIGKDYSVMITELPQLPAKK